MNNEKIIWNFLISQGFTEAAAAGIMGNLYAESSLSPTNLQSTYNKKFNLTDEEYTLQVDSGKYKNFINDSAGYGLAQWTYYTRKANLLNYAKSKKKSIGDLQMQLEFLVVELKSDFKKLYQQLTTTQSIKEASNGMLLQFEKPADQSVSMQNKRYNYSKGYYDKYHQELAETASEFKYYTCMQTNSKCYKNTYEFTPIGILWHSTGCNNPKLSRYVQPLASDGNYNEMIKLLGKNKYNNDYNHAAYNSGLNAWIGKLANGEVATVQTMPWTYRPWGCASGKNGSCNNGWIQFEICEDDLNNIDYFNAVYKEACLLTAFLCKKFNLNPKGTVIHNGVSVPVILCHQDSYKLGLGNNHSDIYHWFKKYNKTMNDVRNDVAKILKSWDSVAIPPVNEQEEEIVTQEQFNQMMNVWIAEEAKKDAANWSAEAREWAERNGLVNGNEHGEKMYKKLLTREELVTVLYRALCREFMK